MNIIESDDPVPVSPEREIAAFVREHLSLQGLVRRNGCGSVECLALKILAHKENRHRFGWQMVLLHRYIAHAR